MQCVLRLGTGNTSSDRGLRVWPLSRYLGSRWGWPGVLGALGMRKSVRASLRGVWPCVRLGKGGSYPWTFFLVPLCKQGN